MADTAKLLDTQNRVAVLRRDQRDRWLRGERVPVEELLVGQGSATGLDPDSALVLIHSEYLLRQELGEAPGLAEYLVRFPEHAERLRLADSVHRLLASASEPAFDHESAQAPTAAATSPPGYTILGELGRGSMGIVYEARQQALGRLVALKVLRDEATADPAALARFQVEAEAMARLSHPHIVAVYDFTVHDGRAYLAVERVDGGSLDRWLNGVPWEPTRAAALVESLAQAIDAAHARGIVHRDLKPSNILLQTVLPGQRLATGPRVDAPSSTDHGQRTTDYVPKISDFGLARLADGDRAATRTGSVLGTPSYMAPEQADTSSGPIGPAADVYSLGAILYELLTGRPPFRAATVVETLIHVREHEPVSPHRLQPGLPRDLETVCLKCLQKRPQDRYATAGDLAGDLASYSEGRPITARPLGLAGRLLRWCRRRPAIAALSGLVVLVAAVGLISVLVLYGQAVVARSNADAQATRALEALQHSDASLYANRIALADHYRQRHDTDRADELLDECPIALRDWEWSYLKRRSFEGVRVYGDHDGVVPAAAFSPDGRYLVSSDGGRNIHVRDRATSRVLKLPGLPGWNGSVALSPDGKWLAVGGDLGDANSGAIKLWNTMTWSEVKSLSGVGEPAYALAFSPDSRRLLSGHKDDRVRVWDAARGELRHVLGHRMHVEDVAYSPDGRLIASASRDTTIRIWDSETGALRATLAHDRPVYSVAFHPQGQLLASSTGDPLDGSRGDLMLWDLNSERVVRKASALAGMVLKARFSPSGRRLATAGWDGIVRIWDSTTLNELLPLQGHTLRVLCVAFSPDGDQLLSGGDDGSIRCWNAAPLADPPRHQPLRTFSGHEHAVYALALTPDGRRLISGGNDYTARVWDAETGGELLTYRNHKSKISAIAVRPDGQAVATGGDDWVIRIWDPGTGADLIQLRGHTLPIMALAFHPDGVRLASASQDGTVRLWDIRSGKQLHQFIKQPFWLFALAFSPDGRRLAAAGDINGVHVWDVADGRLGQVFYGHSLRVVALAFHPDSDRLLSASYDGTVRLWESDTGREARLCDGVRGHGLAWRPNGRHFAASGVGGSLKVWEATSGRRILTLKGHTDDITSVVFGPDGRQVFTAGWDRTIKLWEASPDAPDLWAGESRRLFGHLRSPSHLAVLPYGNRAISSGYDNKIHVWDIAGGRELRRWVGPGYYIYSGAVTRDGKRLIVAGEHTDIRVYEIESGRELRRFNRHKGAIFALAVTPDGRHALTGGPFFFLTEGPRPGPDRDLHLWNINTGEEVRRLSGHKDGVWSIAISPDGRRAASASTDGTVRVWNLDTGAEVRRFDGHVGFWVTVVAFLPDGKRVLSGGTDYHLRLWDVESGRERRRFDGLRGPAPLDCLAIAPDGRHALTSGYADPNLRLWDLDTGREIYHYEVPHAWLSRGTFTPDGRQAIWGASDGVLRIWDLPERFGG
jgi:WD40 repeat protein/serine/threonine protein kinase